MAFSNITTRNFVNTDFKLNNEQKEQAQNNINALNAMPTCKKEKWCKVTYNSYMKNIYGVPYRKCIGRHELVIEPDTSVFVKKNIANLLDPKMVEELSNSVAKGYGLDITGLEETETIKPKSKTV